MPAYLTPLAYLPFIDALPIKGIWVPFMVLAIFLVALTYRTIRREDLSDLKVLFMEAGMLGGQILGFLIGAAVVIWAVTTVI